MLASKLRRHKGEIMSNNKTSYTGQSRRKQAAQRRQHRVGQVLVGIGGVLLLGVLALWLWPLAKPSSARPEVTGATALKPDKEKIDLGDVHLGNTVSASFQLTNVGSEPLHFTKKPYIQVVEGC